MALLPARSAGLSGLSSWPTELQPGLSPLPSDHFSELFTAVKELQ